MLKCSHCDVNEDSVEGPNLDIQITDVKTRLNRHAQATHSVVHDRMDPLCGAQPGVVETSEA